MSADIDSSETDRLNEAIVARAQRRGLSISPEKLTYYVGRLYDWVPEENRRRVLVVGIGHGHDSLLALATGRVGEIVGADPYVAADGNSTDDRTALDDLATGLGLSERVAVHPVTVQEYLSRSDDTSFGCVVMTDVLHHIFVTRSRLSRSEEFTPAVGLFSALHERVAPGGSLVIAETDRAGLRPAIGRLGGENAAIDYFTKQTPREWRAAAEAAGWHLTDQRQYIPWRLRGLAPVLDNRPAGLVLCNRYLQHYRRND